MRSSAATCIAARRFPELAGKYLFADNVSNKVWYLDESTHTATTPASKVLLATMAKGPGPNSGSDYTGISSWGYDASGELYLCQLSSTAGQIYKLQRGGAAPGTPLPATLSATGILSSTAALTPSTKLIPYALNQPFWSDGAAKTRWAVVPNTANIGFTATGEWAWPEGSVLVKHFELPTDDTNPAVHKRLETRLIVKTATRVYGASYKWRADNRRCRSHGWGTDGKRARGHHPGGHADERGYRRAGRRARPRARAMW